MEALLNGLKNTLGFAIGTVVFVAFFPAFGAWFISHCILMGLHSIFFGEPPSHGFVDRPVALWAAYISLTIPVLIALAVALWEVVAIFAAITK